MDILQNIRASFESRTVNAELVERVNKVLEDVSSSSGSGSEGAPYLPDGFQLFGLALALFSLAALLKALLR